MAFSGAYKARPSQSINTFASSGSSISCCMAGAYEPNDSSNILADPNFHLGMTPPLKTASWLDLEKPQEEAP